MSQEAIDAVYRAYDAVSRRDVEAFLQETHADVEGTSYVTGGTTFRGHAGMRQFLAELYSVFPDWHPEVTDIVAHGDGVVATLRMVVTISGVSVEQGAYQAIRVKDGKAIWFCGFKTREEALEAVGLSA